VVLGTFSASFSRSMGGRRWRRSTMSSAGPISVSATRGTWGRERWDVGGARVGGGEKQAGVCGSGTRWLLAQPPHLHHAPIAPPSLRPPHTAVQLLMLFNFTAQPYRLLGHPQPANHPPPLTLVPLFLKARRYWRSSRERSESPAAVTLMTRSSPARLRASTRGGGGGGGGARGGGGAARGGGGGGGGKSQEEVLSTRGLTGGHCCCGQGDC
jgi:hypothetical protein